MKDSERPPVTAHVKFQQERERYQNLSLRQRFERIHQTNLWGARTSVSGLGSEDAATARLRRELPLLLKRLRVQVLLDAPCGDASWIMKCGLEVDYTGMDIVPEIIETLEARKKAGEIKGSFLLGDITRDPLPFADAALCRDCLVHLSYKHINQAIQNMARSGIEYLIATHFTQWQANADIEDGDWRALNFQRAPFHWPDPLELLVEQCDEADGGYRDKSLGVWRLNEIR